MEKNEPRQRARRSSVRRRPLYVRARASHSAPRATPRSSRSRNLRPEITMSNALDVTDTTWDTAVLQSSTPVLVDFWATWCMPCKAMGPYVDKLADEYKSKLKVVKLNTEDNPEVASRYGITAIPTFLL